MFTKRIKQVTETTTTHPTIYRSLCPTLILLFCLGFDLFPKIHNKSITLRICRRFINILQYVFLLSIWLMGVTFRLFLGGYYDLFLNASSLYKVYFIVFSFFYFFTFQVASVMVLIFFAVFNSVGIAFFSYLAYSSKIVFLLFVNFNFKFNNYYRFSSTIKQTF
jgi:hypothetical protein